MHFLFMCEGDQQRASTCFKIFIRKYYRKLLLEKKYIDINEVMNKYFHVEKKKDVSMSVAIRVNFVLIMIEYSPLKLFYSILVPILSLGMMPVVTMILISLFELLFFIHLFPFLEMIYYL